MLKQRLILSLWWMLAIAVAGVLIAAVQHKKQLLCTDVKVEIEGIDGHVFVDEKDIVAILKRNGAYAGKPISDIHLQTLETIIRRGEWIKNAELFVDNNQVLQVVIKEREPIARIFTLQGSSFYIDSSGARMPLSNDYSALVPMFTSFTSDKKKLSKPDSLLLNDVKNIALYIQQDSFWNAQVSQVIITPQSTFEIIPVAGNQVIQLGNADSLNSKFNRLYSFYKQVWAKTGFEKYETISVQYSGQVVATRRGAPKPAIDSAMAFKITNAMRKGTDILKDSSLLYNDVVVMQKSRQDTAIQTPVTTMSATAVNNSNNKNDKKKTGVITSDKNKRATANKQAKAVMPKNKKRP